MNNSVMAKTHREVRYIVVTAILGAVAAVIQMLEFAIPLVPSFIKLDFSELPALIASFALGPVSGVLVCLIKNLFKLITSSSGGIGELANFLIGVCLVLPAGLIYKHDKTQRGALIGCLVGAVTMAVLSNFSNYYITYPFYQKFMSLDNIIASYQAINPNVTTLWDCLLRFNMPFTFCKGLIDSVLTFLLYKRLSPILKGDRTKEEAKAEA